MSNEDKAVIGLVGAGIMGRGIAQLFAVAGHRVLVFDTQADAVTAALEFVNGMISRQVEKGKLSEQQARQAIENLHGCDALSALAEAGIVIEAIIENLDVKKSVFAELDGICGDQTVLASNTSSLLVSDIAAACKHPQRVAGLHFFNPVPLMKVAEVIPAVQTSRETVHCLVDAVSGTGHRAVVAADQPGFLVNHAGRGLYTEGLRILEDGVTDVVTVDRLLRDGAGFRMGAFELMDLTGLDISGKVMQSIYDQFQQEPRYRPSALVPPRVAAGLFGRKTGAGFYQYENGRKIEPDEARPPPIPQSPAKVWVDPGATQATELSRLLANAGATMVDSTSGADTLFVVQPWGDEATSLCIEAGLDPRRCVAIDPLCPLDRRRCMMLTSVTLPTVRDQIHGLLASDAVPVSVINDSPGFVVQRVLATIVNIGCGIVQRRIATVADLEAAVMLGLGYPHGPLAWGDAIGAGRILQILERLQALTGDPRYRPTTWLRRRAALGLSLLTEEAPRF